ncbi:MAG: hypothetical protein KDC92_13190 [Bacteroidetes bacterium]|nr:hypothetical protein [Bacteroidota bacterium]
MTKLNSLKLNQTSRVLSTNYFITSIPAMVWQTFLKQNPKWQYVIWGKMAFIN